MEPYEGWAIVELMGHRRLAGKVSQAEQYGVAMLRLDVQREDGSDTTHFFGGASLYGVHPTTEAVARQVALSCDPAPVQRWELPALPPASTDHRFDIADPDICPGCGCDPCACSADNCYPEEDEPGMPRGDQMRRVVIESPYAGDVERNTRYAWACVMDCLRRGESPYASHLFFTQVLDDMTPRERDFGITAGFAWGEVADARVFYIDLGMSAGMELGRGDAIKRRQPVEERRLGGEWS